MNQTALNVLIVDDCPEDRAVMRQLLEDSPYEFVCAEAESGRAAFRAYRQQHPDCVLLDYHLPDCDAREWLTDLAGIEAYPCPVVVVTGVTSSLHSSHVLELGAQDFIGKSWLNTESLPRTVNNAIERHRLMLILRDSEAEFRSLFNHLPVAYQSLDIEGRWLDANQKMADMLGFASPEQMLGQSFVDFWSDSIRNEFTKYFDDLKKTYSLQGEIVLQRTSGEMLTVLIVGVVQRDVEGYFLKTHCVLFDISERNRMEREIHELNLSLERKVEERTAQLAAASEAKGNFLANMSHEIRTPMTAILGFCQLALEEELPETAYNWINKAHSAAHNLLGILNDILDFSKIEANKLELEHIDFRLRDNILEVLDIVGQAAQSKGLKLKLELAPDLPVRVVGDPLRLKQILLNLVNNAVKFTERGSVTLRAMEVSTERVRCHLRFEVEDTGIGLLPEQQERLFCPFNQADNSVSRLHGGTGLGLAISQRLVSLMGGEIGVSSQYGRGSLFWFTVQMVQKEQDEAPPSTHSAQPGARPLLGSAGMYDVLKGKRVLLVEDNPLNQELALALLRKADIVTDLACNGIEAISKVEQGEYDLILMDCQMPLMDGYEATRRLRQNPNLARLPIIAMTANAMAGDREKCLACGMNDHIDKPVDVVKLFSILRSWITGEKKVTALPGDGIAPTVTAAVNGGLEVDAALEALGNDDELYRELLELFSNEWQDFGQIFRADLDKGDMAVVKRHAHTLKSNAGSVGAIRLQGLAAELEQCAKRAEMAGMESVLITLEEELSLVLDAARDYLDGGGTN